MLIWFKFPFKWVISIVVFIIFIRRIYDYRFVLVARWTQSFTHLRLAGITNTRKKNMKILRCSNIMFGKIWFDRGNNFIVTTRSICLTRTVLETLHIFTFMYTMLQTAIRNLKWNRISLVPGHFIKVTRTDHFETPFVQLQLLCCSSGITKYTRGSQAKITFIERGTMADLVWRTFGHLGFTH